MGRPRTDFGAELNAEIQRRASRGEAANTIYHALKARAEALKIPISLPTIDRRVNEVKRTPVPKPERKPAETAQDVPEHISDDTPIDEIDRYLHACKKGLDAAESDGNLAAVASLAQKAAVLLALKHRMAPAPIADPNLNPDFVKLAAEGEAMLLQLVNGLFDRQ